MILPGLLVSGCGYAPQTAAVTQFSQAIAKTTSAEDGLFQAVAQRSTDAYNLCILAASAIHIADNGQITPVGVRCQASNTPQSLRTAIDVVLKAIQGYATALQDLADDTAGTTFSTNVGNLGKSITADTTSLAPLVGLKGGPTAAQVGAVGTAVSDIGKALIGFAVSRDVRNAAGAMQKPLDALAANLPPINDYWLNSGIATEEANNVSAYVRVLWRNASITDRQALQAIVARDFTPVSTDAVTKALASLATANRAIATAGPTVSIDTIKTALQAANDAAAAVKAIKGGK